MTFLKTVDVILNASAGAGAADGFSRTVTECFAANNVACRIITAGPAGDDITALARRAREQGAEAVVAAGGDGTVSAVATALVGSDTPLGVIPLGTLNHFAKDLHIPLGVDEAVGVLASGRVETVDVGDVNGHTFINNSSLGLYPQFVQHRLRYRRLGYWKWPAFARAALDVVGRYSFFKVRFKADGRHFERRTLMLMIGNNKYEMESLAVGSRLSLTAGQLSLYVTRQTGPFGLFVLALRGLLRQLHGRPNLDELFAREIWIETRRPALPVANDGEVRLMQMPLHYRIRAGALRVIVPTPVP
ncbi:MAG: diacylglycerol/lipid kinase family protein [Acidobacteriota bacterium]